MRGAMRWLLGKGESETVARIGWALWLFWWWHGHFTEARRWMEEALAKGVTIPASFRAKALFVAGTMAQGQADRRSAEPLLEESVGLFKQLGDRLGSAYALTNAGLVALGQGRHERGIALLQEATDLFLELGERWCASVSLPADSGWTISSASAINNEGQIAATGHKDGGEDHALLLTPTSDIPPPDDSQAPSPPTITSPQNNSYDSDGSFSVSGSAEAASTVELFEGTTSKGTTTADSSGAWSIALSGVSDGAHTYTAKATDAASNTSSASHSVRVTVDKSAPKVDSVVPQEDATRVAPGVYVTATFSEGMQAASVKSAFKLYKKGTTSALGASVTYEAATRKATLDPTTSLRSGATYKVVVSTGAKDLAGNSLDQDESLSGSQQKVWFFKIRN